MSRAEGLGKTDTIQLYENDSIDYILRYGVMLHIKKIVIFFFQKCTFIM